MVIRHSGIRLRSHRPAIGLEIRGSRYYGRCGFRGIGRLYGHRRRGCRRNRHPGVSPVMLLITGRAGETALRRRAGMT